MAYELYQVRNAFTKLRSHVYFDNSDILLRRQLVEFESNTTKDINSFFVQVPKPYKVTKGSEESESSITQQKLEYFTNQVNNYHRDSSFFDYFIDKISVDFYPKSIKSRHEDANFITNERVYSVYEIDRVTAFINASIELHLISVLWILKSGIKLDAALSDNCFGNRLILNNEKENIVQGSGLFKPYFRQYQKWRDSSVSAAKELLKKNKDALFLNLDIKNYFHSVRIPTDTLYKRRVKSHGLFQTEENIDHIFLRLHQKYSELVAKQYETPAPFYEALEKDSDGQLKQVILPIGLLSSYVLANSYLKEFDKKVTEEIKPVYYGRYVDDILFVIESSIQEEEAGAKKKFQIFIEKNLGTIFKFHEGQPKDNIIDNAKTEPDLKIIGYPELYCQSAKSLIYYFRHDESDIVIDKLKKELDAKTSEFRDFPEEDSEDAFEESAYHLQYDGTDGKIRTLKDYKENRYGLTVYLANKIFGALRHEKKISNEERDQVLKFFRGYNCLSFYRLWERIFTFLIVNDQPEGYVTFYIHCVQQIDKINNISIDKVDSRNIWRTLIDYLDASHELALSLNPNFFKKAQKAARNFEFQLNKLSNDNLGFMFMKFDPTKPNSFWVQRFRETNMIRHHYVIHPLLNYTQKAKNERLNLVGPELKFDTFVLDEELLINSPRQVKYWECCLAIAFQHLNQFSEIANEDDDYSYTSLLSCQVSENGVSSFHLDEAFILYKKINKVHIPDYELNDDSLRDQFYKITPPKSQNDLFKKVTIQEISVATSKRLSKPKISFANTEVKEENIIASIRGIPNLGLDRYQKLAHIVRKAREEKADVLLFPECFIPINLLSSIVRYAERNDVMTITGLEHVVQKRTAFNFVVTILPVEVRGIKDAVIVFRLKNHYSHSEEELIRGNHMKVPKPLNYRYDLFNWRNIYFSTYYCFELADAFHRILFRGKIDLLVGVEWNRDTPYFSNIVEAGSRDLHSFIAQVNTSQFGDTRLTQPTETAKKDILRLKGGINDAILVATIDIPALREFQRQKFSITHKTASFKPLPPDFPLMDVLKRINNENML